MQSKIHHLNKVEKILVAFLSLIALWSAFKIAGAFYKEYSDFIPGEGGTYTEGVVGKIGSLNPLLVQQGSFNYDLTQLIFSGLSKYDPKTRAIVADLADFTVSEDGKVYTFILKKEAKWHDGEPVTAEDILFTYQTVLQDPGFTGAILHTNDYRGIRLARVDERTVQFFLEKPDSFFLVKTLPGLLPAHSLNNVPPALLTEASFNEAPVGSGRYRFTSLIPVNNHLEMSLEAFPDFYGKKPSIKTLVFKIFPESRELGKNLGELKGLRQIPEDLEEKVLKKARLVIHHYTLPQYVALFLNNDSPVLKNKKVRLALQLGTDKASLVKALSENQIIDTPLLEIDQENWIHQYSIKKANGALFDTEWKLPKSAEPPQEKKEESPKTENPDESSAVTFITAPNGGKDWKTTESKVTIAGTAPPKTKALMVNDYELKKYTPGDPGWSYVASVEYGNLKEGKNQYDVYAIDFSEKKKKIDSIVISQGSQSSLSAEDKAKVEEENEGASFLPTRVNGKGEPFKLRLLVPETPLTYQTVADLITDQWKKIGVEIVKEVVDITAFQKRLNARDYDIVIYGQNLGYNLDAYPYWHSSQAKEGGYNLSDFKNFAADSLLEKARTERDENDRKKTLNDIQKIISQEAPAIFLYSPTYTLVQSDSITNVTFTRMATVSDRFATIEDWYAKGSRRLKKGVNPWTFVTWLIKQF